MVCLRKFPVLKIVGPPWKEGEIRLEFNKVFNTREVISISCTLVNKCDKTYLKYTGVKNQSYLQALTSKAAGHIMANRTPPL